MCCHQDQPFARRGQQQVRLPGTQHGDRVRVEGEQTGLDPASIAQIVALGNAGCDLPEFIEECLVAAVYAIEVADGQDGGAG